MLNLGRVSHQWKHTTKLSNSSLSTCWVLMVQSSRHPKTDTWGFWYRGNKKKLPKEPDMPWERDSSYNPILGMGSRPSVLLEGGVWILGALYLKAFGNAILQHRKTTQIMFAWFPYKAIHLPLEIQSYSQMSKGCPITFKNLQIA